MQLKLCEKVVILNLKYAFLLTNILGLELITEQGLNINLEVGRKLLSGRIEEGTVFSTSICFVNRYTQSHRVLSISKHKQREWTERQRRLAAQRLRMYWQEVHSRKNYKKEINSLIPRGNPVTSPLLDVMPDFLTPIVSPFSPMEQLRRDTLKLFDQAGTLSISNLLPWRLLIISDLSEPKTLADLTEYTEDKQDKVSKLIHLLHLEMEGKVKLTQKKPFGEVQIERLCNEDAAITIRDEQGLEYHFDWQDLSDDQRNKVIADIKDRRILCKSV